MGSINVLHSSNMKSQFLIWLLKKTIKKPKQVSNKFAPDYKLQQIRTPEEKASKKASFSSYQDCESAFVCLNKTFKTSRYSSDVLTVT